VLLLWSGAARAGEDERPKAANCALGFTAYADAVALLETLAAGRPDLARVETIGTSARGRAIVGLRISDNVGVNEPEPEARIIGAIHGNECMAFEVALGLAETLVGDYGVDPTVTAAVDGVETLIVPMANPDGTVASTRGNANDVDLNRNFPFMWVEGVSSGLPGSEPETRALRDDGLRHPYATGLSYHTVANYVNLVWNYTPVAPRHEPELRALMEPYAEGTSYDVVLGWHWYSVYGELTDHDYGTRGTLGTIVEIQSDYGRAAQRALHVPRAVAMLAATRHGLAGRVTDATTGAPLRAIVWVAERRAPVYTEPELGDFHAVLVPGIYAVSIWAPGHLPATRTGVEVPAAGHEWLEVALEPGGVDFGFAVTATRLPREIRDESYANTSVPTDALGPPDDRVYNLEPGGEIAIDLAVDLADHEGTELRLHAGSAGLADTAELEGATLIDGPWTPLGALAGTTEVDLGPAGMPALRFVRIADTSGGRFGAPGAGFDLDSVEVLPPPAADADADGDADGDDADGGDVDDADAEPDAPPEADGGEDVATDGGPDGATEDAGGDAAEDGGEAEVHGDGDVAPDGDVDGGGGGSGCGCNVGGVPAPAGAWLLPALGAAGLVWRRRRT
jgi:carboxypeptidase D